MLSILHIKKKKIIFSGLEGLDEDGDNRSKTKVTIMESLGGEDGNFVSNVGTMIGGKVGNIFGKGLGGIGSKLGGGTSSWF